MSNIYPSSVCPVCGALVENVPPNSKVTDFCPKCSKFAPKPVENSAPKMNFSSPKSNVAVKSPIQPGGFESMPAAPNVKNILRKGKIYAVKVNCPSCGQKIELDMSLIDQPLRCPKCNQKFEAEFSFKL